MTTPTTVTISAGTVADIRRMADSFLTELEFMDLDYQHRADEALIHKVLASLAMAECAAIAAGR